MKNNEVLLVVDSVFNEKDVAREEIFNALETALAVATRKGRDEEMDVRVEIDRDTGEYQTYRRWEVVDDDDPAFISPDYQVLLSAARESKPDIKPHEFIEEPIESLSFGRISAHTARQVIVQKLREAERARIVSLYVDKVGTLVMGTAKREDHAGLYIDLGNNAEGFVPREDMIPRENIRPGNRVRAYLREIREENRGPQLILSRTAPEFLIELFKLEVPEVGQGLIEIMGAARDAGLRAKIAVRSNDPRLDPVGACVGMRGSRVQSVSNELSAERIDIIMWDENLAKYVINAMSPAPVASILIDEDRHSIDIAVEEDKQPQAIGRGGQNVKLASRLLGWHLNVITTQQAQERSDSESHNLLSMFREKLAVDEEVAAILVQEGFSSIEEIAYVPMKELASIEEFDEGIVEELRNRASDVLLSLAISGGDAKDGVPQQDLLGMDGVDEALAWQLAGLGICTQEALAEQAVDDLLEIEGMDEKRAAELIMEARLPWFEEAESGGD